MLEKQKIHRFGKDMYLLGTDEEGTKYWLEEPSWDCGWYWGFGYIETLNARGTDIESHQHADNFYTKWKSKTLKETTFTEDESWALCELFDNFYMLRELADAQHHNGKLGNYTEKCHGFDFRKLFKDGVVINRDCLPFVMAKIISILTPAENETADSLEMKYKDWLEEDDVNKPKYKVGSKDYWTN